MLQGLNLCSDIDSQDYCCRDGDDYLCTPVNMAIAATMISGLIQIGMGLVNFGFLIDYIGFHVLNGFTTAAAFTISFSQVKHIFGLKKISREFFHVEDGHVEGAVKDVFAKLEHTRWEDFIMGISAMLLTFGLEKLKGKYNRTKDDSLKNKFLWLIGTARNTVVVGLGLVIARIVAAADESEGVNGTTVPNGQDVFSLVRDVPSGLPRPANPLAGDLDWTKLGPAAVTIALLGYLESIAIGKTFAQKNGYRLDPTQELRAIGLANVVSSFFSSYPVTGSFSRTAVNAASNVETQLGGVVSGLAVIFSLAFLTPAFYYIPKVGACHVPATCLSRAPASQTGLLLQVHPTCCRSSRRRHRRTCLHVSAGKGFGLAAGR
jgi:sodium-independent sulfate anion transporter 11